MIREFRYIGMSALMQAFAAAFAAVLCLAPFRKVHAAEPWLVEMGSFDAIHSRQASFGKTIGNAMLPMLLVSLVQQRMVGMYGKLRAADPVRWAGYPDGDGRVNVVLVYPSIDKVAKMVLNHPGAERVSSDTVRLPADEGRTAVTYAVFSEDYEWCAFAATQDLARRALKEKYPNTGEDLFAVSCGETSGAFDFDEKGFRFTSRTVTPETAGRLKNIPLLGAFVDSGATHYVKFEDVKKLIAALFKEMAVAKGILKGE